MCVYACTSGKDLDMFLAAKGETGRIPEGEKEGRMNGN